MTPLRALLALGAAAILLLAWAWLVALADPVVRRASVPLPGLERELRAVLVSDIHVAGPDMPPERLARIVARINALRPDFVFIAGDLVSDKRVATRTWPLGEAIAPLAGLRPRIGTIAVLGNHDHWRNAAAATAALRGAGVLVLDNAAARAGPLTVGGLGDDFTGHADLPATLAAMRDLPGPSLLLSHSPDPFPQAAPHVPLMLAGHTHCGQIRLPLVGALSTMSEHGERYACGLVREGGATLVVTAGLGTSLLPLRLGAPPDLWLIRLVPAAAEPAGPARVPPA